MPIKSPDSPYWKELAGFIGALPGSREDYVEPNVTQPIITRNSSLVAMWNPMFLITQTFAGGEDARLEISPTRQTIEKSLFFRDQVIEMLEPCISMPSDSTHAAAYGGPGTATINMGPIYYPRVKTNLGEPWPFGRSVVEMMLGTLKQLGETKQKGKKYGVWPITAQNILEPWMLWCRQHVPMLFGKKFSESDTQDVAAYFETVGEGTSKSTKGKSGELPAILQWVPEEGDWKNFNKKVQAWSPEGLTHINQSENPDFDPDLSPPEIDDYRAIELSGEFFVGKVVEINNEAGSVTLEFDNGETGDYSYGELLSTEGFDFTEF